jgi:hypothetical protein
MSVNRSRDKYAVVGKAYREAFVRAVAVAGELKSRDWRVLNGIAVLTLSWSRLSDGVVLDEVAKLVGLTAPRVSESLNRLAKAGVIGWEPNRSWKGLSMLSLDVTVAQGEQVTVAQGEQLTEESSEETVLTGQSPIELKAAPSRLSALGADSESNHGEAGAPSKVAPTTPPSIDVEIAAVASDAPADQAPSLHPRQDDAAGGVQGSPTEHRNPNNPGGGMTRQEEALGAIRALDVAACVLGARTESEVNARLLMSRYLANPDLVTATVTTAISDAVNAHAAGRPADPWRRTFEELGEVPF